MELWIRSQNRTSLTKVSNLSLQELKHPIRNNTEYWGIGTYYDNLQMLGKYSTKERALKVLDEIQQFINNGGCSIITQDEQSINLNAYIVYEMPKE